jgi:hypothetical protein
MAKISSIERSYRSAQTWLPSFASMETRRRRTADRARAARFLYIRVDPLIRDRKRRTIIPRGVLRSRATIAQANGSNCRAVDL